MSLPELCRICLLPYDRCHPLEHYTTAKKEVRRFKKKLTELTTEELRAYYKRLIESADRAHSHHSRFSLTLSEAIRRKLFLTPWQVLKEEIQDAMKEKV